MKKYQAILFDLDGTIIDPKKGIITSIEYALEKLDISVEDPSILLNFIGPPLHHSFKHYFSLNDIDVSSAVQYYREYYTKQGIYENNLISGIDELLIGLSQKNSEIYVATSKPTIYAKEIIRFHNLEKYFKNIVGSNLDLTKSSKKEIIGSILGKISDIPREDIVMIGDTKYDIEGATSNGIDSIAVTFGYGDLEEVKNCHPTHIVSNISELSCLLL